MVIRKILIEINHMMHWMIQLMREIWVLTLLIKIEMLNKLLSRMIIKTILERLAVLWKIGPDWDKRKVHYSRSPNTFQKHIFSNNVIPPCRLQSLPNPTIISLQLLQPLPVGHSFRNNVCWDYCSLCWVAHQYSML